MLWLSGHDYDWDVEQLVSEVTAWRRSVLKEVRANVRTGASYFVCSAWLAMAVVMVPGQLLSWEMVHTEMQTQVTCCLAPTSLRILVGLPPVWLGQGATLELFEPVPFEVVFSVISRFTGPWRLCWQTDAATSPCAASSKERGRGSKGGRGGLLQWNLTVNSTVELTRVFNCPVVVVFWFVACVF